MTLVRQIPDAVARIIGLAAVLAIAGCAAPDNSDYFADEEAKLRAEGRFKTERVADDAPVTADRLVRNFSLVAFGSEFDIEDGRYVARVQRGGDVLRRWSVPVRYRLLGRATVRDQRDVIDFSQRLGEATGLDIRPADDGATANLEIRFLGPAERDAPAGQLREGPLAELFGAWAGTPEWPCAGEFYYQRAPNPTANQITYATIYIRDEVRGLYRQSCIEEEMSQILGLGRDDASVRPSIFNDDEEFALLTRHDAMLLRILYDPRLKPGMTPRQARPIVQRIARELTAPRPVLTAKDPST